MGKFAFCYFIFLFIFFFFWGGGGGLEGKGGGGEVLYGPKMYVTSADNFLDVLISAQTFSSSLIALKSSLDNQK